jgi:chromosome segregation ATPase
MSVDQVVNVVDIAIHRLPYMESLYGQVKEQVDRMQYKIQQLENYLHKLKEEIASAKSLLNSYHTLCERKRQELENINSEASRIVTLVNRFKNNNEEYLKIKKTVEEEVSKFLADGKVLLQYALASVIEAIRRDPHKYNNLLVSNSSSSTAIISAQQSSLQPEHYDEEYNAMILEVADKLYGTLLKQLASSIVNNTTAVNLMNYKSHINR